MNGFVLMFSVAAALVLASFGAMAIGLVVRGTSLRGGCGTKPSPKISRAAVPAKCRSCKLGNRC